MVVLWTGLGLHAQSTFMKSYVADTINYAHSIAPADDGGFVIAGKYQDTTFNKSISVAKVDSVVRARVFRECW